MIARLWRGMSLVFFLGAVTAGSGFGAEGAVGAEAVVAERPEAGHSTGGHGGGAHHDPTDLTAANGGPKMEDPSEWRYELALCTLVVFFCLMALLTKFAWKPIMTGLEQRERSIQERISEANRAAEQAQELLKSREAQLAATGDEVQRLIAEAQRQAEVVADKVRAEARADAARERDRAIADIRLAKNAALRELAKRSTDMAVSLAGRIVRRELKPGDHATLISQAMEQFPSNN